MRQRLPDEPVTQAQLGLRMSQDVLDARLPVKTLLYVVVDLLDVANLGKGLG